jgi:hypothetical protein
MRHYFPRGVGLEVAAADFDDVEEGAEEVFGADFGAGDVFPFVEGEFVNGVGDIFHFLVSGDDEAGDEFDVEDPAGAEGVLEDGLDFGGGAEEFGAALCVVDGEAEEVGDDGGEDAAEVVADGFAFDLAAEEFDAGTEDHLEILVGLEDFEELGDGVEGGGEVGVEEAGGLCVATIEGEEDAVADGFAFAGVGLLVEDVDAVLEAFGGGVEDLEGAVAAAVIDEDEDDSLVLVEEIVEGLGVETRCFVVAGDDDGAAVHEL